MNVLYKKSRLPLFCLDYHVFVSSDPIALEDKLVEVFPDLLVEWSQSWEDKNSGFTFTVNHPVKGNISLVVINIDEKYKPLSTLSSIVEVSTLLSWDMIALKSMDFSSENDVLQASILKELVTNVQHIVDEYRETTIDLDEL